MADGELGLEPGTKKIKVNVTHGQWATMASYSAMVFKVGASWMAAIGAGGPQKKRERKKVLIKNKE